MKIENYEDLPELKHNSNIWHIIKSISKRIYEEEAFYVCNINEILEKHKIWKYALPSVVPYYAVKCNDDTTVLEILAALGTCFDCASKAEINKVLSLGVSADRIIFANPAKPISHIRYAASVGVSTMTFDSESELYKIQKVFPDARLIVRIRSDAKDAQCPLGMKFGCDPIKEAPRLLLTAKYLNLNVIGVSFHVGSGCREPAVFHRAIASAREIFDYSKSLGFNFSVLDIGGGYPGISGSSINEIANIINYSLGEFFQDLNVQIIAEPGRFYVTSAYTLTCSIHSIKKVCHDDDQGNSFETHRMYYINDGVYGSFNCILYDHQAVNPIPLDNYSESKEISSSIWGPTCDGLDQVVEEVLLPDMNIGDWIVFEDMGAYTLPVASPFNGFPIPTVYYVITQNEWSTFKDIITPPLNKIQIVDGPITKCDDSYYSKNPFNYEIRSLTFAGISSSDLMIG